MSNGGDHFKAPTTSFSHFKSKILAAIDEIRQKKKRPDINASYEHIMKSEASIADKNLIETIIAELTKQNVIINKKRCHGLDSFYKSSTANQSIDFTVFKPSPSKSNRIQNDKLMPQKRLNKSLSQSCPEISQNLLNFKTPLVETFSKNQRGITASETEDTISIDKNIETSLFDTAPQMHPKICTKLPENTDSNSARPSCSKLFQIEAELSALKSYVNCKISSFHSKIESISLSLQVTLKVFQERENKTNEIFHQNMTCLLNELLTKKEIIKSLTETQTTILEALSSFKSNQQCEGNQTNLLTCQKQHQSPPPTPSKQQKPTHHNDKSHSKYNECLQSSDKGICHGQKTEQIENVQYRPKQKMKQTANSSQTQTLYIGHLSDYTTKAIILDKRKRDRTNEHITADNQQIKVVSSVKLLGIQLDDKLNFNLHISNICKSAANQLNALIRLKKFMNFEEKKVLINSYFMANFNYCPIIVN